MKLLCYFFEYDLKQKNPIEINEGTEKVLVKNCRIKH
jgi:hypothetical protein